MSDAINNGGPAFPHELHDLYEPNTAGMTLRDYFAAKAMQAYITSQIDMTRGDVSVFAEENVSKIAYQFADAMLRARESK